MVQYFIRLLLLQVCHGSVIRPEDHSTIDDAPVILPFQATQKDAVVDTDLQADNQIKKERGTCVILCIIGK